MAINKMKKYASFDLWSKDQTAKHKRLIVALRKLVKKKASHLMESVKWGNGVWLDDDKPVIFLYAGSDHLQFGFFNGAKLKDPDGLLCGSGKFVRHTKIHSAKDINETRLTRLIRAATSVKI